VPETIEMTWQAMTRAGVAAQATGPYPAASFHRSDFWSWARSRSACRCRQLLDASASSFTVRIRNSGVVVKSVDDVLASIHPGCAAGMS